MSKREQLQAEFNKRLGRLSIGNWGEKFNFCVRNVDTGKVYYGTYADCKDYADLYNAGLIFEPAWVVEEVDC